MKHLVTRVFFGTLVALAALFVIGAPAQASTLVPAITTFAITTFALATPEIVLALDIPQLLNLLLAVGFPVLVGLVTKQVTRPGRKAVLLATISLASGLVTALLAAITAGIPFDLLAALLTGLAAWIIAIATHYGIWKPTGVTAKVQAIGSTTR